MNNCYGKTYIHTVMYNKTNAKLGSVLVTWPCGV